MTESASCCADDLHYLRDELRRLDSLLRLEVQRFKAHGDDSDPFKWLYISDEDAELHLEERIPQGHKIPKWNERIGTCFLGFIQCAIKRGTFNMIHNCIILKSSY